MCGAGPGSASLIAQGMGAGVGAIGSIFAAKSEKLGLNLDAWFAEQNSEAELSNAREALRQGEFAETRQRLETAQTKSAQRAAMGANGVDMSTGSALNRLVSTDYLGETDAATIRQNAAREAAGYRTRAVDQRNQARTRRAAAKSINPYVSGLTSLVGSAGKIAGDWYAMKKSGAK
jgi:hypothetical protein